MSKGIKKVANVVLHSLSGVVLVLFLLFLGVVLAFSLPRVQTFAAHKAVEWLDQELGIKVSLEAISITRLSRLEIDGLYVEDLDGDTLLWTPKVSTTIDRKALLNKRELKPAHVEISGGCFNLLTTPSGKTNMDLLSRHVTKQLPAPKGGGAPLVISDISVSGLQFRLHNPKTYKPQRSGINYSDMDMFVEELKINTLEINGKRVDLYIDLLTATDKSGAGLQKSVFEHMIVDKADLLFYDVVLATGDTRLRLPKVELWADSWNDFQKFNNNVILSVEASRSFIEAEALNDFVPDFGNIGVDIEDFVCDFDGTVNDFRVALQSATVEGATAEGNIRVANITTPKDVLVEVDTLGLKATTEQAHNIFGRLTRKEMPQDIALWVDRFDHLELSLVGDFHNNRSNIDATLVTDLGDLAVDGNVGLATNRDVQFDGVVNTRALDVGKVADIKGFGKVWLRSNLRATVGEEYLDGGGSINLDRFDYGGYSYRNISLEGTYENDIARVTLQSSDKNLICALEGECDLSWLEPQINLNLSVEGADLAAIGLTPAERSWLACNLEATAEGSSLDEIVGRAMINDLVYIAVADTISTELVNIVMSNNEGEKSLSLYSPLADVEYRGRASYNDVFAYFGGALLAPLPLGHNQDEEQTENNAAPYDEENEDANESRNDWNAREELYAAEDFSTMVVNINTDENLVGAFVPGVRLSADSSLHLEFAPSVGRFSLLLDSGYVEWQDMLASQVGIEASGSSERIGLTVGVEELLALGLSIPDVLVDAYAEGGSRLGATLLFSDNSSPVSGRIESDGRLWYAPTTKREGKQLMVEASLKDSFVMLYDQRWDLSANDIIYNSKSLDIDNFMLTSGEQRLYLDGQVADNALVPLKLELDNIELGALAELLLGTKEITGYANGRAEISSAMKNPFGEGNISLDHVTAGNVEMSPLRLNVTLPKENNNLSLRLQNSQLGTTLIRVNYDLKKNDYEGELTVTQLDLAALSSLTASALTELGGNALVDMQIKGHGSTPEIDGSLTLNNLTAKVAYTGVKYDMQSVQLNFADNVGRLVTTNISDSKGGRADLSGWIDLADLNNVEYSIQLLPSKLEVINLAASEQSAFYGNVAASGAATLSAKGANVAINAALTTDAGSVFSLPLSGSSDFASVDFVQFVNPETEIAPDTTDVVVRKKMSMASKKHKTQQRGNTTIDAQIGVGTDTELRLIIDEATDNVLVAKGEADLNVSIDSSNSDLQIRGDYQIADGYYNFNFQNLISKQFTLSSDSYIRWNGSPLDANLDVDAVYKVKTSLAPLVGNDVSSSRGSTPVECIVNLGGSLADIDLSFDINVPTANAEYQSILSSYFSSQEMMATQFVYLLAAGNFYSDGNTSTQGGSNTGATGTAIGLGLLVDQVSKLVSNDAYKFHLKYKMFDETASTYGVDFETEIIDDRLLLELEANVDTGNYYQTGDTEGNQLTGGGALTLLLDNKGDFILKGFSRTIDRFDENQGLQENGVGIYYKRSFDRLSDLWRKKADKPTDIMEKSGNFATPVQALSPPPQGASPEEQGASPEEQGAKAEAQVVKAEAQGEKAEAQGTIKNEIDEK